MSSRTRHIMMLFSIAFEAIENSIIIIKTRSISSRSNAMNLLLTNFIKRKKEKKELSSARARQWHTCSYVAAHVAATRSLLLGALLLLPATNYRNSGILLLHNEATKMSKENEATKFFQRKQQKSSTTIGSTTAC